MPKTPTTFTNLQATNNIFRNVTVSTLTTAGVVALTADQILGGLILRDPNGAGRADTFPTAAAVYAAVNSPVNGTNLSFEFTIRNTADAAETITMSTATGLTLSGVMTIAQNNTKKFLWVQTSPTAATVYSMGTRVT